MSYTPSSRNLSLLASFCVLACSSVATAQNLCESGQVVVDGAGHCCNPQQVWEPMANQCVPTAFLAPPPVTGSLAFVLRSNAPSTPESVEVTFVSEHASDSESVTLQPVGAPPVSCAVPCVVRLPPGYVSITGTGQQDFESGINIPASGPLTVRVNHYNSHATGTVVGATLTVLGVVGLAVGTVAMVNAGSSDTDSGLGLGIAGTTLGSLLLCFGPIFLAMTPSSRTPPLSLITPGEILPSFASRTQGLRFAGVGPSLLASGGGGLAASFTF